jgi:hypothetical protein
MYLGRLASDTLTRNLLVIASEADSRESKFRAQQVSIYHLSKESAIYPTIISADRENGYPIPFSVLTCSSAARGNMFYAVEDSSCLIVDWEKLLFTEQLHQPKRAVRALDANISYTCATRTR